MTRSEAREQAFIVLFEKIFDEESTIAQIVENAREAELIKINAFAEALLNAIENNVEAIDNVITENAKGWTIARLPKVSLAVLRLAIGEMLYIDEVPAGVSVNEAVELTKKYGTADDASYINGVLGSVAKSL
jgi:N utilization substance protein B